MSPDTKYMQQAIKLAGKGGKAVRPNPLVGAVIVNDGKVVGTGYHTRFGAMHAEREAIADAGKKAKGATMYVTLEPCNHHGKTPPCTDGILDAGIARVVVGLPDPNPNVKGGGGDYLRSEGVEYTTGILENDCAIQNEVFLVNIVKNRPFVGLKIAQSIDGFIAPADGDSKWITSVESRTEGHRLRGTTDAVLVGRGTLKADNPALTVRHIKGDQPRRILLTDSFDLPLGATMFNDEFRDKTLILATDKAQDRKNIIPMLEMKSVRTVFVKADSYGKADMNHVLQTLWEERIYDLMVEGGAGLYSSFLQADVVDRIDLFMAPKIFGSGIGSFFNMIPRTVANAATFELSTAGKLGKDIHAVMRKT